MATTLPAAPVRRARPASIAERRAHVPRPRGVRDLARTLHRVLGLAAGLFLVVTGLSGSALVFRAEIDRALAPHLLVASPSAALAPLQPALDLVARRYPDEPVTRVRMPQLSDGTYELWLGAAPSRYVYVDPGSGAVLGERRPSEFLTGWFFLLHSHLLAGETGHVVAGIVALALVALSISGLVTWWPRRAPWQAWRLWRHSITVARGTGTKRATYDLHRAAGFWASALLLLAGVTGTSLVFHEAFERMAYLVTASSPEPRPAYAQPLPAPALTVDSLVAIARRVQPNGVVSYLYLPTAPVGTFRLRQRLAGETHPNGKSFVHLDPGTGRVLDLEDGARAPRGARLFSMLYPLHIGIVGGTATRVLALLVGLTLPVLAVTGLLVWWCRRRRAGRR